MVFAYAVTRGSPPIKGGFKAGGGTGSNPVTATPESLGQSADCWVGRQRDANCSFITMLGSVRLTFSKVSLCLFQQS